MKRYLPIVLARILLLIYGVTWVLFGAICIIGRGQMSSFLGNMGTGFEQTIAVLGICSIGAFAIVFGGFEITASYGLWRLRKWGAYLAVILSCVDIGISIAMWNILWAVDIVFSVLIVVLVLLSWSRLNQSKPTVGPPSSNLT